MDDRSDSCRINSTTYAQERLTVKEGEEDIVREWSVQQYYVVVDRTDWNGRVPNRSWRVEAGW